MRRARPTKAVQPWEKIIFMLLLAVNYYTYKDGMEQEARWSVEVCQDVMKQKSPPGNESHVSSPYSHYTD